MAPNIDTLPLEILELIGDSCEEVGDWSALRLTCHDIQSSIRRRWIQTFFSHRDLCFDPKILTEQIEVAIALDLGAITKHLSIYCLDDLDLGDDNRMNLLECSQLLVSIADTWQLRRDP